MNLQLYTDLAHSNPRGVKLRRWLEANWDDWVKYLGKGEAVALKVASFTIWTFGFQGITSSNQLSREAWRRGCGVSQRSQPEEVAAGRQSAQEVLTPVGLLPREVFMFDNWLTQSVVEVMLDEVP